MCIRMDRARIEVDFNEMVNEDLVLLSKTDIVEDSEGNKIHLKSGNKIYIFEHNKYEDGEEELLLADGVAEINIPAINGSWSKESKWCCRISAGGVKNVSNKST